MRIHTQKRSEYIIILLQVYVLHSFTEYIFHSRTADATSKIKVMLEITVLILDLKEDDPLKL